MAHLAGILPPKPLELSGNVAENWKDWKQKFQIYLIAIDHEGKSAKVKTGLLLNTIGDEATELYKGFEWATEGDKWKYGTVLQKFEEHCVARKSTFKSREMLWKLHQRPDQSVDQFLSEIRRKMQECDLGTDNALKDSLLKQRLIAGIRDNGCRQRMADKGDELTLEQAIKMARNSEATKLELQELGLNQIEREVPVHAVSRKPYKYPPASANGRQYKYSTGKPNPAKPFQCGRCGRMHLPKQCPAYGKNCTKCGKLSHFAKMCKTKVAQQMQYNPVQGKNNHRNPNFRSAVHHVEQEPQVYDSDPEYHVDSVTNQETFESNTNIIDKWWIVPIEIVGSIIPFKLDTGSNVNIISYHDFLSLGQKPKLLNSKVKLTAYAGSKVPIKGQCRIPIKYKGEHFQTVFIIAEGKVQPILGLQTSERLNLIKRVWAVNETITHSGTEMHDFKQGEKLSGSENRKLGLHGNESLRHSIFKEYNDVFTGLGCVPGQHTIKLKPDAKPVVEPCRRAPFALHDKLKVELDRMEKDRVIQKVTEPTEWVNSLVIVHKPKGKLRICLDPRNLNKAIQREHYKLPTRDEILSKFSKQTIFSKFDASKGFWQLRLDDASTDLCTFNTPFGRYKFLRLPFGISSAPEVFHRTIHEMFDDIPGVDTSMDDIIVSGSTQSEHDQSVYSVLEKCREVGLKLNKEKCEVSVSQVTFLGDTLTSEGVKPDQKKVEAIVNMERPTDKKALQRFLGMINYLGRYIPNLSSKTEPLRQLLNKQIEWHWDHEQETSWQELKNILVSPTVLKYYDPNKEVLVSSDASKSGIGCVLLQKHGSDTWCPIAYASRSMTEAEKHYAQIEKEALALTFACEKFDQYLYARTFTAETDHKPLVSIFSKSVNDCPARIQRFRLRLQKYDFSLTFTPGKHMYVADALSRAYGQDIPAESSTEESVQVYVNAVLATVQMSEERIIEVRAETKSDSNMKLLTETILSGWPEKQQCPRPIMDYWNYRDELSVIDGLVFKGNKVVIPSRMRAQMLNKVHIGHMGEGKCKNRARQVMFWPRMGQDIENTVKHCETCLNYRNKQQKEPLSSLPVPTKPWSIVATDLFEYHKKHYVVCVDSYSNYPEVEELSSQTSTSVIKALKRIFARQGIPEQLYSDNGPCYDSEEFRKFVVNWEFKHKTSSPLFPQSNGLAEKTVQIVKNIFKKCDEAGEDKDMGLLNYRSTPLTCGQSPAELMGRSIRSNLHIQPPIVTEQSVVEYKEHQKQKQKYYYDKQSKPLQQLSIGTTVRVRDNIKQNWKEKAVVIKEICPRSYLVKTNRGAVLRRNRQHLLVANEKSNSCEPNKDVDSENATKALVTPSTQTPPHSVSSPRTRTVSGRITRRPARLVEET